MVGFGGICGLYISRIYDNSRTITYETSSGIPHYPSMVTHLDTPFAVTKTQTNPRTPSLDRGSRNSKVVFYTLFECRRTGLMRVLRDLRGLFFEFLVPPCVTTPILSGYTSVLSGSTPLTACLV